MHPRAVLAGWLLGLSLLSAQPGEPQQATSDPKESAVEKMLSERESLDALNQAIAHARARHVSEQAILEARFLFHVDRSEDKEIAALLPEFLALKDTFKLQDSAIFAATDDWLAVIEYMRALDALDKGDKVGFKRHITEAFWLSPQQGAAFATHIERIRLMDAMKAVRVDFGEEYGDTLTGDTLTLGAILGERKGLVLHFWSPWSPECEATLPDYLVTAEHLLGKDMAVASILPETSATVVADAKAMLGALGKKTPGAWITDTDKASLSTLLKVRSVPAVVLIAPDGSVLFNGHPTEAEFWQALRKINPAIIRPGLEEGD